jgi:hypothetical protein
MNDKTETNKLAQKCFHLLWELYKNDMEALDNMTSCLLQILSEYDSHGDAGSPLYNLPEDLGLVKRFFFPWNDYIGERSEAIAFFQKINHDRQLGNIPDERLSSDSVFPSSDLEAILQGLQLRLQALMQQAENVILNYIQNRLNTPYDDKDLLATCIGSDLATKFQSAQSNLSLLLFAVPGSGKTRSLRRLLSHNYGFYFQSCSVDTTPAGIHEPCRLPGSRDSASIWRFFQYVESHFEDKPKSASFWMTICFRNLVQWRIHMLSRFFILVAQHFPDLGHQVPSLLPLVWLDLQTSDAVDLFDQVLQLSCILPTSFMRPIYTAVRLGVDFSKDSLALIREHKLYFCLDEAQSDLSISTQYGMGAFVPQNLFDHWIFAFRECRQWCEQQQATSPSPAIRMVYSGTSLDIQLAYERLKTQSSLNYAMIAGGASNSLFEPIEKWSQYPLVDDDEGFGVILQDHGTIDIIREKFLANGENLYNHIVISARALRGRPRWFSQYAQAVNILLLSDCQDNTLGPGISAAAEMVYLQIINDLRARIQLLKGDQNRLRVVRSLCKVVVRCYLWDCPMTFPTEDGPTMIAEAFAAMNVVDGIESYYLAERAAAEAAWLEFSASDNGEPSMVDEELLEFLGHNEHDPRVFGKASEVYLAWVSVVRRIYHYYVC